MPGRRCVVYGCSNISNPEGGISVHISPASKSMRDKWLRFVRTHRVNFSPTGRFVVCSDHFNLESFERSFHVEGSRRTLRPGSFPTIWKKLPSQEPSSSRRVRTRRKAVNELLSTTGNEKSSHDQQEPGVELSCASGSSMGEEDCSLQNVMHSSTPLLSASTSSSLAADYDMNDSSALQEAVSVASPSFSFESQEIDLMVTRTPNTNDSSALQEAVSVASPSFSFESQEIDLMVTRTPNTVPNDQDSAGTTPVCLNCESLKKDKKKLQ
ncbi:THAP domain containing [Desmophyllum pertusum]|uniref:THAP domain containing n=1 Tax=Desmophyllum pertusum TaxID=174260 RepID=A0A9X0CG76_9CNID|nr:THAP domain containing [Desmophyllum pertusum]